MEGFGIFYDKIGCFFEGEWKNNEREEYGILYFPNGDRYEG